MDRMQEKEKNFINTFSNIEITIDNLPSEIELHMCSRFLTNDIGIKYIGNMLKDIDIRLYLAYLKMLKDKIKFTHDYDATESFSMSLRYLGVTTYVKVNVPYMENGMDILVTSHELGHGIKSFTKVNNERYLHSNSIYDETISILFGRLCLERYVNDFGYDIFAEQFELLNIRNAIKCLKRAKTMLPKYIIDQETLDNIPEETVKKNRHKADKYYSFARKVEDEKNEIYSLISYPIGISLANVYDNFDENQKEEYLEFVSKYLLNIKHIDIDMILKYFDIPFDADFYIHNFKEYIQKFESVNSKKLTLGGKK